MTNKFEVVTFLCRLVLSSKSDYSLLFVFDSRWLTLASPSLRSCTVEG